MDSTRRTQLVVVAAVVAVGALGFAAWRFSSADESSEQIANAPGERPTMRTGLQFDEDVRADEGGLFDDFDGRMGRRGMRGMWGMMHWGGDSDEERRRRHEKRRAFWESLSPEEREARRERRRARRREHFLERVQLSGVSDDSALTKEQLFDDLRGAQQATRDCMRASDDARSWFRNGAADAGPGDRSLTFTVNPDGEIDADTVSVAGAPDVVLDCFRTGFGGAMITAPGEEPAEVEIELPTRRGRGPRHGPGDGPGPPPHGEGPPPGGERRPPPPREDRPAPPVGAGLGADIPTPGVE